MVVRHLENCDVMLACSHCDAAGGGGWYWLGMGCHSVLQLCIFKDRKIQFDTTSLHQVLYFIMQAMQFVKEIAIGKTSHDTITLGCAISIHSHNGDCEPKSPCLEATW